MIKNIDFYDPFFLEKLKDLHIIAKKLFQGRQKGKRKSLKKGSSLEFSDFRRYAPGDDFRFIDWTIHARLKRYMIRSFWDETNISVYILIDTSMSMGFGSPSKLTYAKKISACLASTALSNHDKISITGFSDTVSGKISLLTGKKQLIYCFGFLQKLKSGGKSDFKTSMKKISQFSHEQAIVIILSDLLYPDGYKEGLISLLKQGHEVHLIKINAQPEFSKNSAENLRLYDSETGEHMEVFLNDELIKALEKEKKAHTENIKNFCRFSKILFFETDTNIEFDKFVLKYFKSQLFIKH
ncbi:DUF58 domain-containing protein [bacterium]|nr:DUF58 domain-containing protein [bacterium]